MLIIMISLCGTKGFEMLHSTNRHICSPMKDQSELLSHVREWGKVCSLQVKNPWRELEERAKLCIMLSKTLITYFRPPISFLSWSFCMSLNIQYSFLSRIYLVIYPFCITSFELSTCIWHYTTMKECLHLTH